MQFDTSKLTPDVATREKAAQLFDAREVANKARNDAHEKADPEGKKTEDELDALPDIAPLAAAYNAAEAAYGDDAVPQVSSTYDNEKGHEVVNRCRLSNLPILEDDTTHTDTYGEREVLSALIAPARSGDADFEEPEDEDEAEAA